MDKHLKKWPQSYDHEHGLTWKETPAGIEVMIAMPSGALGRRRILWRTLRAALRRKDKRE